MLESNESQVKTNSLGDKYITIPEGKWDVRIKTDKKANVAYWNALEAEVEIFLKSIAKNANIQIHEFGGYDLIKEVTQCVVNGIEADFPEANFPYVDQDF